MEERRETDKKIEGVVASSMGANLAMVLMKNKWFLYGQCLLNLEIFVLMEKGCLHIELQTVYPICQYIEN